MSRKISVSFLGGVADGVNMSASCYHLSATKEKQVTQLLIDCGLWQGSRAEYFKRNSQIRFDPRAITGIVNTHAHLDHSGLLPKAVRDGFKGRIFCTEPNAKLLEIILKDSAKIQALEAHQQMRRQLKKAEKYSKRSRIRQLPSVKKNPVLFDDADISNCLNLVKNQGYPYGTWVKVAKDMYVKFYNSGHVLGGAICVISIEFRKNTVHIGFSGDLGRRHGILLPAPEDIEEPLDYWFIESTYGGQSHPKRFIDIKRLYTLVRQAAERQSKIIIPCFTLERFQEIGFILSEAMSEIRIPKVPVYFDSPMATNITGVFDQYWQTPAFNESAKLHFNPFDLNKNPYITSIASKEESLTLAKKAGSCIIIAGSGMGDAGRVRTHLVTELHNPNSVICLVGHMAEDSLCKKLQDGINPVIVDHISVPVRASIVTFESFSGHASGNFLVEYTLRNYERNPEMKTFIVHGDKENGLALQKDLCSALNPKQAVFVTIPQMNQRLNLH